MALSKEEIKIRRDEANRIRRDITLTVKQRKFARAYVQLGDGEKAVRQVYNIKNSGVAKQFSKTLKNKPKIKRTIDEYLQQIDYDATDSLKAALEIQNAKVDKIKGNEKLAAAKLLLEISGNYVPRSMTATYRYNVNQMDHNNLETTKDRYNRLLRQRNEPPNK